MYCLLHHHLRLPWTIKKSLKRRVDFCGTWSMSSLHNGSKKIQFSSLHLGISQLFDCLFTLYEKKIEKIDSCLCTLFEIPSFLLTLWSHLFKVDMVHMPLIVVSNTFQHFCTATFLRSMLRWCHRNSSIVGDSWLLLKGDCSKNVWRECFVFHTQAPGFIVPTGISFHGCSQTFSLSYCSLEFDE